LLATKALEDFRKTVNSKMCPCPPGNDVVDRAHGDSKPFSQFIVGAIFGSAGTSDLKDIPFGQFLSAIQFSNVRTGTPLHVSIAVIVALGAQEKMIWTNASSVVALMENEHSFWDWSIVDLPRDTVSRSEDLFSVEPSD
jgi:hypothetical protein